MNSHNSVTAVILTKNEEADLPGCLASIPDGLPILVIDSGSTDRTVDIAKEAGASVKTRAWTGFVDQRNFALSECGLSTDWILFIDADERFGTDFYDWLAGTLPSNPPVDVFEVPSMLVLDGRLLRFAPGYPILHPRLVRRKVAVFKVNHAGHGEAVMPCRTRISPTGYLHLFHTGNLAPWLEKHLRLAGHEAGATEPATSARGKLAQRLGRGPVRAVVRFLYHFVLRGGFLDGRPGLQYALMYAWYDLTIHLLHRSNHVRKP